MQLHKCFSSLSTDKREKTLPCVSMISHTTFYLVVGTVISFKMAFTPGPWIERFEQWTKTLFTCFLSHRYISLESYNTCYFRNSGRSENLGWRVIMRRAGAVAAVFWSAKILGGVRKLFLLENFMNIDETTFFKIFFCPLGFLQGLRSRNIK